MRINKNLGFTVAEVLITIGVIGTLTMLFTTITNGRNTTTWQKSNDYKLGIVKYDKIYNALNENITKQLMRNNDISNLNNLLANALNTLNSTCTDCANNRANNPQGNNLSNLSRVLSDGSEITVYSYNGLIDDNDIRYIVYVDTNGKEKPNTIGKDILPIYIDKDGNVINVNQKTGKAFEQLTQKKYDDTKIYTFQCPNEDTVLSLRKNSETGLYEDINKKKCSKICDENYAKTVYANYLKNTLSLFLLPTIVKNGTTFTYGTNNNDIIYSSEYDKYNCFTVKPDKCTLNGAKKYFKDFFDKSPYNLSVNKNNIKQESGNLLSYLSGYYTYSAKYNENSCEINNNTKTCKKEQAKQKFADDKNFPLNSIVETTNGFKYTTTEKIYTANYDSTNCYSGYTITDNECSVDKAKQQFASWTGCSNYTYSNGSFSCIIKASGKSVYSRGGNHYVSSTTVTTPESVKYYASYNKKDCIANYQVKVCQTKTTTTVTPNSNKNGYVTSCGTGKASIHGCYTSGKFQNATKETVTTEVCENL